MTEQVMVLAASLDDLSLMTGLRMIEETPADCPSTFTCMHVHRHVHMIKMV